MIKKFIKFINESIDIKTEYQLLHLNKQERLEYFTFRLKFIEEKKRYYFVEYEYYLLPKNIKNEYNKICVSREIAIPKYQFEEFSDELKIEFINILIKYNEVTDEYFDDLSDELKYYTIDKMIDLKYCSGITFHQFEWCNDELKNKYIDICHKNNQVTKPEFFPLFTKDQKNKIVTFSFANGYWIPESYFKFLSVIRKRKYIERLLRLGFSLDKIGNYEKKWYLAYKRKHNL